MADYASQASLDGVPGTGGGGAGGAGGNPAGKGASGVVIIRYPTAGSFSASGGTVSTSQGYRYHLFTSSGTFTPSRDGAIEVLAVGGGASGGSGSYGSAAIENGAGGGGGGTYYNAYVPVAAGSYSVIVGAGGAQPGSNNQPGAQGGTSSIEGLNCTRVDPPQQPDLTAGAPTLSPSPGTAGQSVSLSATVSNSGAASATNFPNVFQVADSGAANTIAMISGGAVSSLAAGASTGISASYTFSSPGSYNVRACADNDTSWVGTVVETNESNNCGAWTPITISPASCTNGATNPPACNTCPADQFWNGSSCVACQNGGCTDNRCTNGATNPPACNTCPADQFWNGSSCTVCTGGCTNNQCNNGATNPPACTLPLPTAMLWASPATIDQGQSTKLFWNSTNATSCTAAGGFSTGGAPQSTGGVSVSPSVTSTYQITCSGPGGTSAPAQATVTVNNPLVTITATPARVRSGQTSTVEWSSSQVRSCVVSGPGLSSNARTGSQVVTVTTQSTYTITCETNGAPAIGSATVNVIPSFEEF